MPPSKRLDCSIVIPAFNASRTIEELILRIHQVLSSLSVSFEIIVIDDASQDNTWGILIGLTELQSFNLRAFRLMRNSGQHSASIYGIRRSVGKVVITMDDDLEHQPEEIPKLFLAADGIDTLVIAANASATNPKTSFGSRLVNAVLRTTFRLPPSFQLSTFRAFSREIGIAATSRVKPHPYLTAMLLSVASQRVNVQVSRGSERESRYSLRSRIGLAIDLLFSHSKFLSVGNIALLGLSALFSLGVSGVLVERWATGREALPGWTSTLLTVILVGAITQAIVVFQTVLLLRVYRALLADESVIVAQSSEPDE